MTEEVKTDKTSPKPVPTPSYSTWQLLTMLVGSVWSGLTGTGKWVGGKAGGVWTWIGKTVHDSLLVTLLVAVLAGFVGGKAATGNFHFPSIDTSGCGWIFPWNWHWPTPGPNPGPGPTPTPAPIPAAGLHVLVVGDEAKMTGDQINALKSTEVRTYLNSTCPKGPDGKSAEYRIWPSTVDTTNESQVWKDAFARTTGKTYPWIIVSNPGKGGFEGPLPADQASLLTLLKKFGG